MARAQDKQKGKRDTTPAPGAPKKLVAIPKSDTRKADRVMRRLAAAARRKGSLEYISPVTGKPIRKATNFHRGVLIDRAEQAAKIAKKREQRRKFAKLSDKQKAEHREAGRNHRMPPV